MECLRCLRWYCKNLKNELEAKLTPSVTHGLYASFTLSDSHVRMAPLPRAPHVYLFVLSLLFQTDLDVSFQEVNALSYGLSA